jgi:hypothetical protein
LLRLPEGNNGFRKPRHHARQGCLVGDFGRNIDLLAHRRGGNETNENQKVRMSHEIGS